MPIENCFDILYTKPGTKWNNLLIKLSCKTNDQHSCRLDLGSSSSKPKHKVYKFHETELRLTWKHWTGGPLWKNFLAFFHEPNIWIQTIHHPTRHMNTQMANFCLYFLSWFTFGSRQIWINKPTLTKPHTTNSCLRGLASHCTQNS